MTDATVAQAQPASDEERAEPATIGYVADAVADAFDTLSDETCDVICAQLDRVSARIAALEARLAALEARPTRKHFGPWRAGVNYGENSGVVDDGSMWVAMRATSARPGESADWSLCCKRGKDGRDGRDAK